MAEDTISERRGMSFPPVGAISTTDNNATLRREFLGELAETMQSLAISTAQCAWRGDDKLLMFHLRQQRLVLVESLDVCKKLTGEAQ